jgi:peptidoglycan/xylan/chitin deacetylase (PgdA/CDA1 family)
MDMIYGQITPENRSRVRRSASEARSALRRARNWLLNRIDAPVTVLTYHRVTSLTTDPQQLAVSPGNFRDQMLHLKERYQLTRFESDWTKLRRPLVVVTFDDGYDDNVLEALPILEEVGVPATFFISTEHIGTLREFWWDDLERIVCESKILPPSLTGINGTNLCWPTVTAPERWHCYLELHQLIKRVDAPEREQWFEHLRSWAGVSADGRQSHWVLTESELCNLAASKWVTIGAHTITHTRLSALPVARQEAEILGSRRQLEEMTGKKIEVFSYPFGNRDDYSMASRDICLQAGFTKTAANFPGQAHRWTDPHQIPRHLVRNWPVEEFERQMKRFIVL